MLEEGDRGQFLNFAALFEGGLVLVAIAIGWFVGRDPLKSLFFDWMAVAWGVAATVPLFAMFWLSYRFPVGPLLPIKRFLVETLGPSLSVCRWYDLVLLALLVGFSEELVFRGLLQPWIENAWGYSVGLVASNVLFGLVHFVTPLYAVVAMLIGGCLGGLLDATEERNLLTPIVTHALYDYLAFLVVIRAYRTEPASPEHFGDDFADDTPDS